MAFTLPLALRLSGATHAQERYWRRQGLLVPEVSSDGTQLLYSFRDVVALRTFAWLRTDHSLQQIRTSLYNAQFLDVVEHPSEFVFVKTGRSIGLQRGGHAVDVLAHPGQELLGTMDDVLGYFVTRQKRPVQPLGRPHESIAVDARRFGGWPTIEGTRVPYDVIAQLLGDGSIAPDDVGHYFPGVTPAQAQDALAFAREVSGPTTAAA